MPPSYGNFNRNLNAELDIEPSGNPATRLMMRMIAIQERKKDRARQAEMDRIAEEDRQRKIREEEDIRQIKLADFAQKYAAMSDRPKQKVEQEEVVATTRLKQPEPLAPMTPEEAAVHAATGQPAGPPPMSPEEQAVHDATGTPAPVDFAGLDTGSIDPQGMPDALPLPIKTVKEVSTPTPTRKLKLGDLEMDIPLYDRSETQERALKDARDKMAIEVEKAKALSPVKDYITIPNDPEAFGEMAGMSVPRTAAAALIRAGTKSDDPFAKVKGVGGGYLEAGPDGKVSFVDTTPETSSGEKRKWVTNLKTNEREYVTDEQMATADPGTYSDVRPTITSVRKADPAKLKIAYEALGSATVPNSLWSLATAINSDDSMMGAAKGWARDVNANMNPRTAARLDPQVNLYRSQIQGFASSIAKAFGESGVLTNQDIQRAISLFPLVGEDSSTTKNKLTRIKTIMEAGMTSEDFRSIFGRDPEGGGSGGGGGATPPSISPKVLDRLNRY